MRRIRRAAVVSAILLLAIGLVVSTWAHFSGGVGVGWATAVALLALGYIPVAILGFRLQNPLLRAAAIPAAVCVGLLSFGFFGALACWALAGAARLLGVPIENRLLGAGVFGLGLAAVIYGLFNAARIRVTRYTVALRHLPGQWEGKTGVLVSDIHLGNIRSAGFARRIVARINALQPDIVFIGGDMFDGARVDLDACVEPWSTLRPPAGTYFVTGNHDEFSDSSQIMAALRKVGVRVLDNEMVPVQGLQIVGIHDGVARDERTFREILARARLDAGSAEHPPQSPALPSLDSPGSRDRAAIVRPHPPGPVLAVDAPRRPGLRAVRLRLEPQRGAAGDHQQRGRHLGSAHAGRHPSGDRLDSIHGRSGRIGWSRAEILSRRRPRSSLLAVPGRPGLLVLAAPCPTPIPPSSSRR